MSRYLLIIALCCFSCGRTEVVQEPKESIFVCGNGKTFTIDKSSNLTNMANELLKTMPRDIRSFNDLLMPVLIQPTPQTTPYLIRQVLNICGCYNFVCVLLDEKGAPLVGDGIRFADLSRYEKDPFLDEDTRAQVWMPTNTIRIDITSKSYSKDKLKTVTRNAPVLVTCAPSSTYGDLVDVLRYCQKVGTCNILVVNVKNDDKSCINVVEF